MRDASFALGFVAPIGWHLSSLFSNPQQPCHGSFSEYLYIRELGEFVRSEQLHDLVLEKAYTQRYVTDRLRSIISLDEMEAKIKEEFTNICQWVTVYELMGDLLIAGRTKSGEITPEVAVEVSEFILNVAIATFDPTGQSQAVTTTTAVAKGMQLLSRFKLRPKEATEQETPSETDREPMTQERQLGRSLQQLRTQIDDALTSGEKSRIRTLVGKQLSIKSKSALGKSLPYLDMLFFYELEKYEQVYQNIVDVIYDSHYQVILDYSANYPIRQILMRQNRAAFNDATEILRVVAQLQTLS